MPKRAHPAAASFGWRCWRKRERQKARGEGGETASYARALFLASASATARRTAAPIEERVEEGNLLRTRARLPAVIFDPAVRTSFAPMALRRVRGCWDCCPW